MINAELIQEESPEPETQPAPDPAKEIPKTHLLHIFPKVIWRVTKRGLVEEHRPAEIKRICTLVKEEGNLDACLVWHNGEWQYVFLEKPDGSFSPFLPPDDKIVKTSPATLYARAITYQKTWSRLLRRRLKKESDALTRTSKMVWVGALIVVCLFMIFTVTISIISSGDSESAAASDVQPYGSPANLTLPSPTPTNEIPRGVKQ